MRIVATKNRKRKKKFPWRIILDNGRKIPVPSQYNFKTEFIRPLDLKTLKRICSSVLHIAGNI